MLSGICRPLKIKVDPRISLNKFFLMAKTTDSNSLQTVSEQQAICSFLMNKGRINYFYNLIKDLFDLWNQGGKPIFALYSNHDLKVSNMQYNKPDFNLICPHLDGEVLRSEQVISKVPSDLKSHQCINCSQPKQHFLTKNGWNELWYCKIIAHLCLSR